MVLNNQRLEWRNHLTCRIIDSLAPDVDAEPLLTELFAGIDQAFQEGLEDASYVCRRVANEAHGETKRTASILIKAIEELKNRNARDSERSLHTW